MSNLPEILKSAERTAAILEDMADMRAQEADYEWDEVDLGDEDERLHYSTIVDEDFFNAAGGIVATAEELEAHGIYDYADDEADKGV